VVWSTTQNDLTAVIEMAAERARLAVVSATIDLDRALACFNSWRDRSVAPIDYYIVEQGRGPRDWEQRDASPKGRLFGMEHRQILGVVPAFARGVAQALHDGAQIVACLHDDLEIEQDGWDEDVVRLFKACPRAGLCGFGGGTGLGASDIYQTPYNPMQLARQRFGSNMRHAEAHGERWTAAQPVACLDGFSQIGTWEFWRGLTRSTLATGAGHQIFLDDQPTNLFAVMESYGIIHHAYDAALGAYAARHGYQVWFLPVACHHYGGRTAVADDRYTQWAKAHVPPQHDQQGNLAEGDTAAWLQAHQWTYNEFRDILPIRV
jgi:hypothetical protein